MELTTASITPPTVESTSEHESAEASQSGMKLALIKAGAIGFLAIAGYVLFFSGIFAASSGDTAKSEQWEKFQVMIGMGPKAGATRFIAPLVGSAIAAAIAFSVLSAGGRDVQTAKEQSTKAKKPKDPEKKDAPPEPEPVEEECNLASYQLFKSMYEAQAAADAAAQANPTT